MAKWEYNPVAIRYQNKHHIYASSGIHLIIKDGDNKEVIIDDFVLTLNHIPNVSNYQIIINEITPKKDIDNEEEDDENVMWGWEELESLKILNLINFKDLIYFLLIHFHVNLLRKFNF